VGPRRLARRARSETGETPQARYAAAGPPSRPEPVLLREAFRWSAVRLARNIATVAFEGNVYSVDPFLVGRKVELVFDPLRPDRHHRLVGRAQGRPGRPAGHRPTLSPQGPVGSLTGPAARPLQLSFGLLSAGLKPGLGILQRRDLGFQARPQLGLVPRGILAGVPQDGLWRAGSGAAVDLGRRPRGADMPRVPAAWRR
jgi:hypothetical protein